MPQAVLCNPFDLVKARMAAAPREHRNSLAALTSIARSEGGAGSLWRGAPATTIRAALGSGAQLATYDQAKRLVARSTLLPSGVGWPVLVATCASAVAYVTAAAPADVVRTRLMLSRADARTRGAENGVPQYAGALDCLRRSVQDEGVGVLFRGCGASLARLLPVLVSRPPYSLPAAWRAASAAPRVDDAARVRCSCFACNSQLLVMPLLERLRLAFGVGAF